MSNRRQMNSFLSVDYMILFNSKQEGKPVNIVKNDDFASLLFFLSGTGPNEPQRAERL